MNELHQHKTPSTSSPLPSKTLNLFTITLPHPSEIHNENLKHSYTLIFAMDTVKYTSPSHLFSSGLTKAYRNAANTVSDTVQGKGAEASKEANKCMSIFSLRLPEYHTYLSLIYYPPSFTNIVPSQPWQRTPMRPQAPVPKLAKMLPATR